MKMLKKLNQVILVQKQGELDDFLFMFKDFVNFVIIEGVNVFFFIVDLIVL